MRSTLIEAWGDWNSFLKDVTTRGSPLSALLALYDDMPFKNLETVISQIAEEERSSALLRFWRKRGSRINEMTNKPFAYLMRETFMALVDRGNSASSKLAAAVFKVRIAAYLEQYIS